MLITETLAFHDRRTQDLSNEVVDRRKSALGAGNQRVNPGLTTDTNPKLHDPTFNSAYRPQGSLFIELYNPWTMLEPRTADLSAVDPISGVPGVQLNKVTPVVNGRSSPVWRLVIVDPTQPQNQPANGDETPDPDSPIVGRRPTIERAAYFVNITGMAVPVTGSTDAVQAQGVSYYPSVNTAGPLVVPPSGYAVVGSGDNNQLNRTYIGVPGAATRMLSLNPGDLTDARVVRNAGNAAPPGVQLRVLGIDFPQRLSVSEPTVGYPVYEKQAAGNATYTPSTGQYNITLDIPVDAWRDTILGGPEAGIWALLNRNATVPAYRIIYLQRLADPTRPWAPDTTGDPQQWNPYRTIDAMTVDLTTFNGISATLDPSRPADGVFHFESHQRGEKNYLPSSPAEMDLWKQEPANKNQVGWTSPAVSGATAIVSVPLSQSLGYLNTPFGSPATTPAGDPQYPFPWLNFSYRPFNNEYELLLVPALSSSRLLARSIADPRRVLRLRGRRRAAGTDPGRL